MILTLSLAELSYSLQPLDYFIKQDIVTSAITYLGATVNIWL
jgi:hypothetical protein